MRPHPALKESHIREGVKAGLSVWWRGILPTDRFGLMDWQGCRGRGVMKRMWCGVRVAVSALGLALSGIATAQTPAADPPAGDADIVVRGQTQKQLHATVQALTPTDYGRQVGRWKEEICFKVVGLNDEHAGLIRKQFLIETGRLHLRVSASAGCSANLLVVIADNADEITAKIYKDERWMFGDPAYGNPPRARVDALMKAQPVRWFVTNRKVRAFNSGASHIVMPTREDTDYAYVLVDVNRLSGITWRQLGDMRPSSRWPGRSRAPASASRASSRSSPIGTPAMPRRNAWRRRTSGSSTRSTDRIPICPPSSSGATSSG